MMSSIVSVRRGLSQNLISALYQAWNLKLMEVHTLSPLRIIYARRIIAIDSDVLRDLVPLYNFKNLKNTRGGVLLLVMLQAKRFLK